MLGESQHRMGAASLNCYGNMHGITTVGKLMSKPAQLTHCYVDHVCCHKWAPGGRVSTSFTVFLEFILYCLKMYSMPFLQLGQLAVRAVSRLSH